MNKRKTTQTNARIPAQPGVYLMKDTAGQIIYVGKARNLRKRLATYFGSAAKLDPKSAILVKQISDFETVITKTEKEALILESNLIKRHRPRYNVILKDDKRYPSLRLNMGTPYPSLSIVRKIKKDRNKYFGPFSSALAVRQTLKFIDKTFKLRKCSDKTFKQSKRPCLHHQMGRCLAPCSLPVDPDEYQRLVKEVILFLKGRTPELIKTIKSAMAAAAQRQAYEKAAILRDRYQALERTLEKQIVVMTDFQDRDIIALAQSGETSAVNLLAVRGGFLQASRSFFFQDILSSDTNIIETFMRQYYDTALFIPPEILIDRPLDDRRLLAGWLSDRKGRRVTLTYPQRGAKVRLVKMSQQNASQALDAHLTAMQAQMDVLQHLKRRLKLKRIPLRIECFDNSSLGGTEPVASQVVFEKGRKRADHYRRYRIKSVDQQDDYAYFAEVLRRRYGKGLDSEPLPDLLVVDGGKGQLNIARAVLAELKLGDTFDVVGIAKPDKRRGEQDDKIFKPGQANPVPWGRNREGLLLLQHIRDEAHRCAVTYQRRRRHKRSLQSVLDTISGIGPKRKAALIRKFKSLKKIREAKVEDLIQVPGINRKLAEVVIEQLGEKRVSSGNPI